MKNDTSLRKLRRIGLGAALAAGTTIALASGPATALGAPYADLDTLTISSAGPYTDLQTVTVSGSGLTPGEYDLSVCQYAPIDTFFGGPAVKIPACGVTVVPVTVSGAGTFSTGFTVVTSEANAHAAVGTGQPSIVDFDANSAEFILVAGHGAGFSGSQAADSVEFNVTP